MLHISVLSLFVYLCVTNTEVDIRESLNWTKIKDHHDVLRMIP